MAHHRVQSAGPHESKLCCYCGQNGVFLVAWMWITFSLVVIAACSYWLWLVNNHDGNRYRSTDPVLGGTADFYSFSTDTLRILLGCFIGDTILNCLVSFILLYGAYENKRQYEVPWLAATMFLLLIGAGFGIYTIYLVIVESESSEDASFSASLCGLFWLILGLIMFCWMTVYGHFKTLQNLETMFGREALERLQMQSKSGSSPSHVHNTAALVRSIVKFLPHTLSKRSLRSRMDQKARHHHRKRLDHHEGHHHHQQHVHDQSRHFQAWSPSRQEEGDGGEVQRQTVVSPSMFIMKDDSESVGTYSGASSKGSSVRRLRHPMVGITIHTQSSSDSVLLGPHSIDTSVNTLSTVTN